MDWVKIERENEIILIEYKKLSSFSSAFGEKRGNCSGLLKCCINTESYKTCKSPCIECIEKERQKKDNIPQPIVKQFKNFVDKNEELINEYLYRILYQVIKDALENGKLDKNIDKSLVKIIDGINDDGKIKNLILERFLTKISC